MLNFQCEEGARDGNDICYMGIITKCPIRGHSSSGKNGFGQRTLGGKSKMFDLAWKL